MTDAEWEKLAALFAEQNEEEQKWLDEGGSYLCEVHPEVYLPCRRCDNDSELKDPNHPKE